ncbi:hypothetical protein ABW20_dc0105490 [Dactylellina cionopaga]|nr:hypothetical protein ABW20_dc0105490 [Dactylellina cionopaga]
MSQHYSLRHKPNFQRERHYRPSTRPSPIPEETALERYEAPSTNPYVLQINPRPRGALLPTFSNVKLSNTNPKMTREKQTKVVVGRKMKSRNLKGTRIRLEEDMDLSQARMENWDRYYNSEADEARYLDWDDEYELENGEYLRTIFPSLRDFAEDRALGEVLGDEELRAMGLLYDSEDEHEHDVETVDQAFTVPCTSMVAPRTPASEADFDELWELVEGRRLPTEERGEWDIVSEF